MRATITCPDCLNTLTFDTSDPNALRYCECPGVSWHLTPVQVTKTLSDGEFWHSVTITAQTASDAHRP